MKKNRHHLICALLLSTVFMSGCSAMIDDINAPGMRDFLALAGTVPASPFAITGLAATTASEEAILVWNDPTDSSFQHIEITWTPDGAAVQSVPAGIKIFDAMGLRNGREYVFTVRAIDDGAGIMDEKTLRVVPALPGAPADAVYVYDAAGLDEVRNNLAGYYVLMTDIDLSGYADWVPIGDYYTIKFSGTLDGNGHEVRNLSITGTADCRGLFGCIGAAGRVLNLSVSGTVSGRTNTGILAGQNVGTITDCHSSGTVTGTDHYTGGLVGMNGFYLGNAVIIRCSSAATVDGIIYTGGLAGDVYYGTITGSYATGIVQGFEFVGGLTGSVDCGTITDSYATGAITATEHDCGGLTGLSILGNIINCYSTGNVTGTFIYRGGLAGDSISSTVTSSYFADAASNNGIGILKTSGWNVPATFTGWDFAGTWGILGGAPYLLENPPGP
ncbi:MAG: hypothetical protein JXA20_14125 [Spirochaetes bacterium]|nr:hypothetical protein [Spirochaetota bacterium]